MLTVKYIILYLFISSIIIIISKYLNYIDKPNKRTFHSVPTINTGGIIIYLFFLTIISQGEFNHNIELIVSIGFFVTMLGFVDDRINLNPSTKIIFLTIPTIYLIFNGMLINDLGRYEIIGLISLGKFKIPFLILAIGLLINATNYIDGIDGLLLTFFSSCLIYYLFLIEDLETKNLISLFIYGCIFNLILNLLPSNTKIKVFTGDSGSLFLGFLISFLTIDLYNSFNIHPTFLIWPLWYPVYDFLFVSLNRILKKKSIFDPDKSHLHHIIAIKFKNNNFIPLFIFIISNTIVIYFGYQVSEISKILSLSLFIIGFLLFLCLRMYYLNNKQ